MNDPGNIPLHCNICPKKPDFSDVSHLLTHIASKGHLSHYYKLKVRASQDDAARRVVEQYDRWYDGWSVEDLMSERMTTKEKRRTRLGRGSTETSATPRSTPSMAAGGRRRSLHDHTVDPALNDRRVKEEPLSRSTTPLSNFSFDQTGLHRAYAPPMQDWRTGPYAQMPMKKEESIDPPSDESFRPATRRPARRRRRQSISAISLSDNDEDIYGTISDASKLKGVYWPGMAMFDSATPDMRRKRNQKKAISVVQQLEATSKVVEATEMVFSETWEFKKKRSISSLPDSDDSPIKGESSPVIVKRRSTRRPRQPMAERDVNTGVNRRRNTSHHPSTRGPYFDDNDEDFDLTYRPGLKRTGFSIHRDNSGPDITFDQPASLNYLTSGFQPNYAGRAPLEPPRLPVSNSYNFNGHDRKPSISMNGLFRPIGPQENLPLPKESANPSSWQQGGLPSAQSALAAFESQFQFPTATSDLFSNYQPSWDIFADNTFFGSLGNAYGNGYGMNQLSGHTQTQPAGTQTANPLLYSGPMPMHDFGDDERTISAASEDR